MNISRMCACACVCVSYMHACMYVCIYVCVYMYVCRYVCKYILPAYGNFPGTFHMLPYIYNTFPTLSPVAFLLLMTGLHY